MLHRRLRAHLGVFNLRVQGKARGSPKVHGQSRVANATLAA